MVEDVLVKVEKIIITLDFIVLEMDEDRDTLIILILPFLVIGSALIDIQKCDLTIRMQSEKITFNFFKENKFSNNEY